MCFPVTINIASNATWVHSSDARYKKDIKDNTIGLDFINALRTVNYKWKAHCELDPSLDEYDASKTTADSNALQHGLIAQEVKQIMDKQGVSAEFGGWTEDETHPNKKQGISEQMFVYPLIKAVQELSEEIEKLKNK